MSQVPVVSSEQGGGFQREPPVTSSSLSHLSLLATSHTGAAPKFLVRGRARCRVRGGEQTPRQVAQNPTPEGALGRQSHRQECYSKITSVLRGRGRGPGQALQTWHRGQGVLEPVSSGSNPSSARSAMCSRSWPDRLVSLCLICKARLLIAPTSREHYRIK